jgi:hypothetical protein
VEVGSEQKVGVEGPTGVALDKQGFQGRGHLGPVCRLRGGLGEPEEGLGTGVRSVAGQVAYLLIDIGSAVAENNSKNESTDEQGSSKAGEENQVEPLLPAAGPLRP